MSVAEIHNKDRGEIGFISRGLPNVIPSEAFQLCSEGAVMIDIRLDYMSAFKKFAVPTVLYMPRNESDFSTAGLDENSTYIIAESTSSTFSRIAVKAMLDAGFKHVYNLAGGIVEWERDGLPLVIDKKARLSGSCTCQLKYRG